MKLLALFALLCVLNVALAGINIPRANALFEEVKNSEIVMQNPGLVEEVRKKILRRGCGTNICFALDGSGSVGDDFELQKQFVNLIAAITGADDTSKFAATVYGLVNENISKLTKNAANFILDVTEAPFPAAPVTFISAGLGFCFNQLDDFKLQRDVNKIVLLGDGFANFGDLTGPLAPVAIAQQWRDLNPPNNNLCAVAVGFSSTRALEAITGDPALVLEVTDWPVLLNILDTLVEQICFKEVVVKAPCPCKCQKTANAEKKCRKKKFINAGCKVIPCSSKKSRCCDK